MSLPFVIQPSKFRTALGDLPHTGDYALACIRDDHACIRRPTHHDQHDQGALQDRSASITVTGVLSKSMMAGRVRGKRVIITTGSSIRFDALSMTAFRRNGSRCRAYNNLNVEAPPNICWRKRPHNGTCLAPFSMHGWEICASQKSAQKMIGLYMSLLARCVNLNFLKSITWA